VCQSTNVSFADLPRKNSKSVTSHNRIEVDQRREHVEEIAWCEVPTQLFSCTCRDASLKFIKETLCGSERSGSVESESTGMVYSATPQTK
jgi:hypothetical protein